MIMAGLAEAEGVRWYLSDHLGTVRDLADAAGEVIDHLAYDSFGNVLSETNPAAGDRFRFTGREFDAATGQYYYRARYYDGIIGRFTSEDPLGFGARDMNLARYVGNSPARFTDPLGLETNGTAPSIVDEHPFWNTASGVELRKRIEKARDYLKATLAKLINDIREKPGWEPAVLRFILDNVDKVVFTPSGFFGQGEQAVPSVQTEGGRLKKLTIHLQVFNVFNLKEDEHGKPWKPPEIPVEIPLPGHMGMGEEDMNALAANAYEHAKRRQKWLEEAGLTAPRTEMWSAEQIAALMANELLHAAEGLKVAKYKYKLDWPVAHVPGVILENGSSPMDFLGSLPPERKYENPMAADSIMHEIYYYGKK